MKKHYILAGLLLLAAAPGFAQVKIGAAGAPDASATLEVTGGVGNNKGLLLPRLTTAQRNAISNPAKGLLIFNTTTNEVQTNIGTPAVPVWSTTPVAGWNTTGNVGTDPATNFLGTTDNQPLSIRTNNAEAIRVTADGKVGVGIAAPAEKLHLNNGGLTITNNAAIPNSAISIISDNGGPLNPDNVSITAYGPTNPIYGVSVARGTAAAPQNSQAGDNTGSINFAPRVNGAFGAISGITSTYVGDGTTLKSRLRLFTSNIVAMTIDSSSNVGIGSDNPTAKLHLNDGGLTITNNGAMPNSAINVISDNGGPLNPDNVSITAYGPSNAVYGTSVARGTAAAPQNSQAGDATGSIYFAPRVNGAFASLSGMTSNYVGDGTTNKSRLRFLTSGTVAMTLDSSNNVGIGIQDPTAKLHLNDGGLTITNNGPIPASAINIISDNAGPLNPDNITITAYGNSNAAIGISAARGTASAPQNSQAGDNLGQYAFAPRINGAFEGISRISATYVGDGTTTKSRMFFTSSNAIAMAIDSSGFIGIGTTAPTARLSVNGTTNNLSGTWGIFSDARVKTIDEDYKDGLATVMKIHPVKFHYNANAPFKSNEQQIGVIAQEMEAIAPYMVSKMKAEGFNDLRQYNNQALPYMLVNAIQEQQKMIENLKAALAVSKADNAALKADVSKISALAERMQTLEASLNTTAAANTAVSK